MTIAVAYKYAANPQDANVMNDGNVDWSRAKAAVSEYDPVAIQLGRTLADSVGEPLVGVSVGTETVAGSMAKKAALARGLDSAMVVADNETITWNPTKVASALAQLIIKKEDVSLVITGDSSIDDGSRMMSALVAGFLKWPCFQEVISVEKTETGYKIAQAVTGGNRVIEVNGPVVISATSDAVITKAASMKEVLAAGKKPMEVIAAAELDLSPASTTRIAASKPPVKARKNQILTGENAAEQLIACLRADSLI